MVSGYRFRLGWALLLAATGVHAASLRHPLNVRDLIAMDRVGDPQLSPDGRQLAFSVSHRDATDGQATPLIYLQALDRATSQAPRQLLEGGASPRWSADGRSLYYLAPAKGLMQLWRKDLTGDSRSSPGADLPHQISHGPLDVQGFKLAPDGRSVLLDYSVYRDCDSLACTADRLKSRAASPAKGQLYTRLFVRHWDEWADGRRNQLFVAHLDPDGHIVGEPVLLTRGIDGDVPSKPEGDDSEYAYSPDGRTVYFDVRIAGHDEPWSTNFDIYKVAVDGGSRAVNLTASNPAWDGWPVPSPDGRTLYYLAQKRPGFESDRFGIQALDLATGRLHEVAPQWDRSAGGLGISADGRHLYVTADQAGQHPLFQIDPRNGRVTELVADGTVDGYSIGRDRLVVAHDDLLHPAELFAVASTGGGLRPLTHFNQARLSTLEMGQPEFFSFKGWHDEPVQGYVVKPADYQSGRTYPVAFIIHGGPQGAMGNGWSYRWNPQAYAGQGFAVVTINFHGSTGYGQAFTDSISGDWGGKPLDDLKLGWQAALQRYPFLDGTRACALGASYGGYMVYWMAGVWNQPWRCLVDHDGVFDARMMYYATDELWFEEHEQGGTPFTTPALFERFNPVNHVADWRVPMLIIHGGHDFRIPETQGLGAFTALQRRGIPSELLRFPDENHWVLQPQDSVQWHDTVMAWLKRWTAPAATTPPERKAAVASH
ncbi:dipeptidyl-peptidase 5 [Frateuria aurantia]